MMVNMKFTKRAYFDFKNRQLLLKGYVTEKLLKEIASNGLSNLFWLIKTVS